MSLVEAFSIKDTLDEANAAIGQVYENAARNRERKAAGKEKKYFQEEQDAGVARANQGQIKDDPLSDKEQSTGEPRAKPGRTAGEPSQTDEPRANEGRAAGEPRANIIGLSDAQTQIYLWLKENQPEGQFTAREICNSLSMPYGTVRKSVERLQKTGILDSCFDRVQQVNHYTLNLEAPVQLSRTGERRAKHGRTEGEVWAIQGRSKGEASYNSSSSSLNEKPTTGKNDVFRKISEALQKDPELGYWRQKELKPKQVVNEWIPKSGMSAAEMIESLKHCRFEMVDLGVEESRPVENVFNYFFRVIEKTGYYPKPKGYKSFEEKRIEREQERAKQLREEAERLEAARNERLEAETKIEFEKMMQDPESELYKACYAELNQYQKRNKSMISEAMWRIYKKKWKNDEIA